MDFLIFVNFIYICEFFIYKQKLFIASFLYFEKFIFNLWIFFYICEFHL